jgi:hypothetical protein
MLNRILYGQPCLWACGPVEGSAAADDVGRYYTRWRLEDMEAIYDKGFD